MQPLLTPSLLAAAALPVMGAQLTGSGTGPGDSFGTAAATAAGVGAVGAPRHAQGGLATRGAAFLYRNVNSLTGSVAQTVRLVASDGAAGDRFGSAIGQDGSNQLVVGAPGDDSGSTTDRGSAYLFRDLLTISGTASQAAKLEATTAASGDAFGSAVAAHSNLAVVGAPTLNFFGTVDRGAVYLFRNLDAASGTVNESSILYDTEGAANDNLGSAVAVWLNTAVVGAPGDDVGTNNGQGSVCLFRNLAAAGAVLTQSARLTAGDGAAGDAFGSAVGLGGTSPTGLRHVVAGAPGDDTPTTVGSGAAYLFRISDTATGTLTHTAKLTASGAQDDDSFGTGVAVSGTTAIVGAPAIDDFGFACLYLNLDTLAGTVTEAVRLWPATRLLNDAFGSAVALDGDTFIVGALAAAGTTTGSGSAWTGSVAALTRLDTAGATRTVERLGFRSRTNWIIGDTADGVVLTLAADSTAEVPLAGTSIFVGRSATADNNRLVVEGTISNTRAIQVGDSVNTGNELRVNGAATATTFTILQQSILSGDGLVEGAVAITGSLRPGNGTRDTLNVAGDLTWHAGTAWQFDLAAGNLSDRLAISGTGSDFLKGTGAAARTFDFLGSSQTGTYTLVTWSGTTTFTAADFAATNLGAGLGATFAIAGNSLTVTIGTALTPLQQWRQTHFSSTANAGNGADAFDADRDGLPNLVEYALGTSPVSAGSSAPPVVGRSADRLTLRFTPQVVAGLTYAVQTSPDLATWTTTPLAGLSAGAPFTWTDTATIASGQRRYVRLRVGY